MWQLCRSLPCLASELIFTSYAAAGLIGWVPNTDTLHALIREYRDARKTPLNIEHRLMLGMSPDYDHLPLINKVEVFQHALDSTDGEAWPGGVVLEHHG